MPVDYSKWPLLVEACMEWIAQRWTKSMIRAELRLWFEKDIDARTCQAIIKAAKDEIKRIYNIDASEYRGRQISFYELIIREKKYYEECIKVESRIKAAERLDKLFNLEGIQAEDADAIAERVRTALQEMDENTFSEVPDHARDKLKRLREAYNDSQRTGSVKEETKPTDEQSSSGENNGSEPGQEETPTTEAAEPTSGETKPEEQAAADNAKNDSMSIEDVASIFEQFDLSVLPVVDRQGHLVGRITSDDIYDVIEERATEQIYNLAGVNDEVEQEEDLLGIFKNRASWLFINLITAILASIVIGMVDETIAACISLAILMPIVASMGGNAGTQTLTVMVRKMALGDIDVVNAKQAVIKEFLVALLNGLRFAVLMGIVAYVWFDIPKLGLVIGLAMIINLLIAGSFGALIPLMLKRMNIDPAVGSTVLLTTATDIFGFFSFLGLASLILVK